MPDSVSSTLTTRQGSERPRSTKHFYIIIGVGRAMGTSSEQTTQSGS